MNTATRNLEDDHIHILKLTDVMEIIARSENPDINHIESIIDIIRNFADGLHHAKEENLFFPALEQKGFSSRQGPVAVMLHEHVEGRNFVKGIADNLELFKKDNKQAISKLLRICSVMPNCYATILQKKTIFFSGWLITHFLTMNRNNFWSSLRC